MVRAFLSAAMLFSVVSRVSSGTSERIPFIVLQEVTTVGDYFGKWLEQRASYYGFNGALVRRLITVESGWDPHAVSSANAYGLMQLLLPTAQEIMNDPHITREHLLNDRYLNAEAGLKYLRWLNDHFQGNIRLALLSYNRGIGKVMRAMAQGANPSNGYENLVLGIAQTQTVDHDI